MIKEIEVSGYKSLKQISLKDLQKVNVFYGENNTGKSNILKAIELFFDTLKIKEKTTVPRSTSLTDEVKQLFYNDENEMVIALNIVLDDIIKEKLVEKLYGRDGKETERLKEMIRRSKNLYVKIYWFKYTYNKYEYYITRVNSVRLNNESIYQVKSETLNAELAQRGPQDKAKGIYHDLGNLMHTIGDMLSSLSESFIMLPEFRKFEKEFDDPKFSLSHGDTVSGDNIKKAMFNFRNSTNPKEQIIYEETLSTFNDTPFEYGKISTSREFINNTYPIEIFVKSRDKRLSITNLGSGPQQILMIIFNVILNKDKIFAIGEPEVNLSPSLQTEFSNKLYNWVKSGDSIVNQLFISTHSPIFKKENYYLVSHDGNQTVVESPTLIKEEEFIKKDRKHWGPFLDALEDKFDDEYRDTPGWGGLKTSKDSDGKSNTD